MTEDRLHLEISRGARAKALLDDELIQEAFLKLHDHYIAAWRATSARDTVTRETLWQAVNVLDRVRDHITAIVNNGKLALAELNMRAKTTPQ